MHEINKGYFEVKVCGIFNYHRALKDYILSRKESSNLHTI
jgi:hypothetical protein